MRDGVRRGGVSGTGEGGGSIRHNSSNSAKTAADVSDPAQRPVVISRGYFKEITGL